MPALVSDLNEDLWWWGMREGWTGGDDKMGPARSVWQHASVAERPVPWAAGLLPPQNLARRLARVHFVNEMHPGA
jgi:hypothetical protein